MQLNFMMLDHTNPESQTIDTEPTKLDVELVGTNLRPVAVRGRSRHQAALAGLIVAIEDIFQNR